MCLDYGIVDVDPVILTIVVGFAVIVVVPDEKLVKVELIVLVV